MNIEIANRLVNLRKQNNLSQEALAEKLGISRQAVSKWERAEASPDTDNLILLARLYGVSLDELLQTEDEIPRAEKEESSSAGGDSSSDTETESYGSNENEEYVHVDKNGIYVNGEKYDKEKLFYHHAHFPMALIIGIAYIVLGCVYHAWHPGWLLFLLIPIWHSLVEAIRTKNAYHFAYPVLVTLIFLCLGIFKFWWHPGWVVYLTIPLYYWLASYLQRDAEDSV